MNGYDVKRLALILAVQAEIEGMKAENVHYQNNWQRSVYGVEEFERKAKELRDLANSHDEQL
mgnify:CR=1 FL=1